MNKEIVNWTKKQLQEYLQKLNERAEELKAKHPVYQEVKILGVIDGHQLIGYEIKAPLGIRDEITFTEGEIEGWRYYEKHGVYPNIV